MTSKKQESTGRRATDGQNAIYESLTDTVNLAFSPMESCLQEMCDSCGASRWRICEVLTALMDHAKDRIVSRMEFAESKIGKVVFVLDYPTKKEPSRVEFTPGPNL